MDVTQKDHLKAYGIAFMSLKKSYDIEWLLNYRGGSFLLDDYDDFGGFEGTSGNDGYDSSFHGIVNLCGAVGDQYWIVENEHIARYRAQCKPWRTNVAPVHLSM